MGCLMNVLWLVFGGILTAVEYMIASLLMMITIVGIPFGMQTMKIAGLALWPFGKEVRSGERSGGCLYILMNVLWIFWEEYGFAFRIWASAYCCVSLSSVFLSGCSISNLPLWRWRLSEKILWNHNILLSCIGRRLVKEEGRK